MEVYKEKGGNGTKKKRWKLKLNHLPPWSIHCWPGGLAGASLRKCWDNVCNFKHFQAWLILCCGFEARNSCKSRAWGTRSVSHVSARTRQPVVTPSWLPCSCPPLLPLSCSTLGKSTVALAATNPANLWMRQWVILYFPKWIMSVRHQGCDNFWVCGLLEWNACMTALPKHLLLSCFPVYTSYIHRLCKEFITNQDSVFFFFFRFFRVFFFYSV